MVTVYISIFIFSILVIGFSLIYKLNSRLEKKIKFVNEYRNKFVEFSNTYFQSYDRYSRSGKFDNESYIWLTKNVNKIQNYVGSFGLITYKPAFQNYIVNNYPVLLNTIPKFRDGQIENFDVHSVDDCLLRYIGHLEEYNFNTGKNLRNPIIWFREGVKEILSLPIFIFSWFGLISNSTVNSIKNSFIYKIITGLIALVTLLSGLVTIVIGYDQTIDFLKKLVIK